MEDYFVSHTCDQDSTRIEGFDEENDRGTSVMLILSRLDLQDVGRLTRPISCQTTGVPERCVPASTSQCELETRMMQRRGQCYGWTMLRMSEGHVYTQWLCCFAMCSRQSSGPRFGWTRDVTEAATFLPSMYVFHLQRARDMRLPSLQRPSCKSPK